MGLPFRSALLGDIIGTFQNLDGQEAATAIQEEARNTPAGTAKERNSRPKGWAHAGG